MLHHPSGSWIDIALSSHSWIERGAMERGYLCEGAFQLYHRTKNIESWVRVPRFIEGARPI